MKTSKTFILALGIVIICFTPLSAIAEKPASYGIIKVGFYSPNGDLEDLDFDTGFNGEIVLGSYLHPNIAMEVGVGYFQTDASNPDIDLWVIPLTLTTKVLYPIEKFEPFALAGIGLYFEELDLGEDDDDTVFGFHLGAGANYNITEDIFFGVEGKYLWSGEAKFASLEADLDGFLVTGNLGLRF